MLFSARPVLAPVKLVFGGGRASQRAVICFMVERGRVGRVFLLSPANLSGRRANILLRPDPRTALAQRLQTAGATVGEVFSFVSGLYFRGKLAYANAFGGAELATDSSVWIVTSTRGLLRPDELTTALQLHEMADVRIDPGSSRYRVPLERDAARLASQIDSSDKVVLLGSIATPKYVEPLLGVLGDRLMIPQSFIGLGNMARGALMLRAARELKELEYLSLSCFRDAHRQRPPRQIRKRKGED